MLRICSTSLDVSGNFVTYHISSISSNQYCYSKNQTGSCIQVLME